MDHVVENFPSDVDHLGVSFSLPQLASWFFSGALIVGGIVPFVPQYMVIKRTETTEGFSLYVCLALLLANTLRILFWFGHNFELPLLIQSVWMNFAMLALVHLCVRVRRQSEIVPSQPRTFTDFDPRYFWEWSDFLSYLEFMVSFMCGVGALVYVFLAVPVVIETIGFLAVIIEAMLGVPQFYRNFVNKSTLGMSIKMVVLWTLGDIYKTTYFIIKETPLQFVLCGSLQLMIDCAILCQVCIYGSVKPHSKQYKHSS